MNVVVSFILWSLEFFHYHVVVFTIHGCKNPLCQITPCFLITFMFLYCFSYSAIKCLTKSAIREGRVYSASQTNPPWMGKAQQHESEVHTASSVRKQRQQWCCLHLTSVNPVWKLRNSLQSILVITRHPSVRNRAWNIPSSIYYSNTGFRNQHLSLEGPASAANYHLCGCQSLLDRPTGLPSCKSFSTC